MAERNPNLPQSSDPELQADLVRLLQVQGPLGMLNVLDVVIPVVSMGQVVPLDVQVQQPSFRSTDVFGALVQSAPINTVFADTGQLAAGIYDVTANINSRATSAANAEIMLQHRDAANAVTLAILLRLGHVGTMFSAQAQLPMISYEIGPNERLRLINDTALTNVATATMFVRIRG